MAAVAGAQGTGGEGTSPEMVTITINDIELEVPKGELIVESVKRLGLEIPIFCYHPRMKPVGMCRMCIVEVGFKQPDGSVRKMPKPQAGCTLPADANMVVYTDTEMVHRDRKGVLEFLLINHPLDCPICDRGGECPLQNNTLFYGPSTSRFTELKRHLPKAFPLSKYVTLDLERCIQCGRCVRFTEEISGDSQLAFRFRGANMQPSTFELTDFQSKFSGNTIEICPVGALTNAQYRFRARPWDIETRPAICTVCSNGCNIWFDHRVGKMVRIQGRTNEAVNEEWTCDRGKFGHEFYNSERRLTRPLMRQGDALVECTWPEAYEAIIEAFQGGGNKVAGLGGATCSNEDVYLFQKMFRERFGSNNLDHRYQRTLLSWDRRPENTLGVPSVQDSIASFEDKRGIFVFGSSLADEEPILFLRVRKAWFNNGAKVVVAHDTATDVDGFAHLVLRYRPGTGSVLIAGLVRVALEDGGMADTHGLRKSVAAYTPDHVSSVTGVRASDVIEAGMILAGTMAACVATRSLLDQVNGEQAVQALAAFSQVIGGSFNLYGLEANDQGCEDLGILPDVLPGRVPVGRSARKEDELGSEGFIQSDEPGLGTHGILAGCADRAVKALWLLNSDPLARHPDTALARQALENVPFLVYQGIEETEAMHYASVVLPMAAPAESDGTFTNIERRVQRMRQVFAPKGEAKAAWRIFSEVMVRMKPETPFFNPKDVMREIGRVVPWFEQGAYEHIEGDGRILEYNEKFDGNMAASVETFEKLNVGATQASDTTYGAAGPHLPSEPV
jgi:NADH-quinone oxidoreductase subunit G